MRENTPEIYIAEDDVNIREIERYALKSSGFLVQEFERAGAFSRAIENAGDSPPDLILLDIMLPDEDGIAVLRRIRGAEQTERIPVLMVTADTAEVEIAKVLDEGADDCMTKPFDALELISHVHALLRRTSVESEEFVVGEIRLVPEQWLCTVSNERIPMTYREFQLLEFLMRHAGIILQREALLDHIWGAGYGKSRTLDAHIRAIRRKLGESGARIETIRSVGYMIR